jgi:hypothetical protein
MCVVTTPVYIKSKSGHLSGAAEFRSIVERDAEIDVQNMEETRPVLLLLPEAVNRGGFADGTVHSAIATHSEYVPESSPSSITRTELLRQSSSSSRYIARSFSQNYLDSDNESQCENELFPSLQVRSPVTSPKTARSSVTMAEMSDDSEVDVITSTMPLATYAVDGLLSSEPQPQPAVRVNATTSVELTANAIANLAYLTHFHKSRLAQTSVATGNVESKRVCDARPYNK